MNIYDWMKSESPDAPPLNEPGTREDPGNRPHVPDDENGTTRELHSNSGGGRHTVDTEHQTDHVITDPEDISVSNESIIEDIRKFFKIHNRGKDFVELDGNVNAGASKIFATLEKTFANDEWVNKQTPIDGKIKVGDLADRISLDNLLGTIKETSAINDSYQEAVAAAQFAVVKQLQPLVKGLNPNKLTDQAYEKIRDGLSDVKPLSEIIKKPTRSKTNLVTGKVTDESRQTLTVEETLSLAKEIITAMKQDHSRLMTNNEELERLMGDFFEAHWYVRRKGEESESYNTTAWENLCDAVVRKMPGVIPESMAAFRQFEGACVAAVIYMERSFKGGKVSNESITVSNEGLLDAIKDFFTGKPKDVETRGAEDLLPKLKETLLNDGWLQKQKFTESEVSVKLPSANIDELVSKVAAELEKAGKVNGQKTNAWIKPFSRVNEIMRTGDFKGISLEQAEKLLELSNYDDLDFDVARVEPKNFIGTPKAISLPALDMAGVKKMAKALQDLYDARANYTKLSMGEMITFIPHTTMQRLLDVKEKDLVAVLKELHENYSSVIDYAIESFWNNQFEYYELVDAAASGILDYVTKSITGIKILKS